MNVQLDLRALPWDFHQKADPPHVAALRERLNAIFAGYKPRRLSGRDEFVQELTVPADDTKFAALLKQFDAELRKAKPPVAASMRKMLEPAEVKRARFMGLTIYGDDVDLNNYEEPLSPVALAC